MKELQAIVRTLARRPEPGAVLATLVTVEGSSYRRAGARLLLLPDGTRVGSISGGCLEEDVLAHARHVAATGTAEAVVYDTTSENDLVWGVGLGCHGIVRVLIERLPGAPAWVEAVSRNFAARRPSALAVVHQAADPGRLGTQLSDARTRSTAEVFVQTVPPPTALYVFGAGNDAQPLVRLAKELGWLVTIADPRPAFATAARFPLADAVITAPPEQLADRVSLDRDSVAVVMTHHYVFDVPLVRALVNQPLAYLGLLGPRKRAAKILDDIVAAGTPIPAEQRARIHAPVGLDLGADGPEQVALAIVAEIQTVLGRRDGRPLRERSDPIHSDRPVTNPAGTH